MIEWELVSAMDIAGVKLPRCQIIANVCGHKEYRGPECNYTGTNYFTALDEPTSYASKDVCGRRLSSCKLRFGSGEIRFGGFPAASLIKS